MSHTKRPPRIAVAVVALSVALSAGAPPSEIRLLPAGEFIAVDGRPGKGLVWSLSDSAAAAIVAAAAARDSDYVIDYEHQTLHAPNNGQPAPAAGWYKTLEWRPGDGLYATDVRWTDAATKWIEAGEYRYISPVFGYTKTGAIVSVAMASLVNNPGLDGLTDLSALSALFSSDQPEEEPMDELIEQLIWLLNLPVGSTPDDIKAQLQKLIDQLGGQTAAASFDLAKHLADNQIEIAALKSATPDPAAFVPAAQHAALVAELSALRADNAQGEVNRIVTEALAAGKLVPAQEDWARKLGGENLAMLSAFIDQAPVAIVPGATQTGGARPEGAVDMADAASIHQAALKYQTEQSALGRVVNIAEAVSYVTQSAV